MKTIVLFALIGFGAPLLRAQVPSTAAPSENMEIRPVGSASAAPAVSVEERKKKRGSAIAKLKQKHTEEIKRIKENLKSSAKTEAQNVVKGRKTAQKAALDALKSANKKDMDTATKEVPGAVKGQAEAAKPEKPAEKSAPVPERK